jgi:alkanesulfonate monooxygenase SsuD/methylene tetrahydromethanopterin reductase-like flavin-dependent oxidoreductase (luciferase family)
MAVDKERVWFGVGLGDWSGADVAATEEIVRQVVQADRDGLDLFAVADHPYFGQRLDAYATVGFCLGQTSRISGVVTVTNLPSRPAPVLARTVTSLGALSGGRIVLGIGAGGSWDAITTLGVTRLTPAMAVVAVEEAITLVRALSSGGEPVTVEGQVYRVSGLEPAPVPAPPVWTGAIGPKALAVTGRLADGWVPGRGADWLSAGYRESRPVIDEAAAAAGRDPAEIVTVYNFGGPVTDSPQSPARDADGRWLGGTVGQWIDELTGAVVDHGASGFVYRAPDGIRPDIALARWAHEIVPAVREAVNK